MFDTKVVSTPDVRSRNRMISVSEQNEYVTISIIDGNGQAMTTLIKRSDWDNIVGEMA